MNDAATTPAASAALAHAARCWQRDGVRAVLVEVVAARGSVPRDAGSRMLVSAHDVVGSIGGGHLEWQAIAHARQCLGAAVIETRTQDVALGPTLGQCCGGAVTLHYGPLADADASGWALPSPRFTLQLHGAGHVGRALVRLLAELPCRVQWVDEREAAFPPDALPPHVVCVATDAAVAEVDAAPPGASFVVMTHSHALDLAIVRAVLRRGEFAFVGLIGSATKRASFCGRLHAMGVDAALTSRLVCPVGLPGIRGKEPALIALAVAAQLLQVGVAHPP